MEQLRNGQHHRGKRLAFVGTLIVAATVAGVTTRNLAAHAASATAATQAGNRGQAVLEGAWRASLTATGLPPFQSLTSFASDGTLVTSASLDLTPQFLSTPGYGAWTRVAGGRYSMRVEFFTFTAQGVPSGSGEVTATLTVDGDHLSGPQTLTLLDPSGHILVTTSGTIDANRIEEVSG
jgi:hypothetical protein